MLRVVGKAQANSTEDIQNTIRLVVGCVEDVCGSKWSQEELKYVSPIAASLIKVFYEMWIQHICLDNEMYKLLYQLHKKWICMESVAVEWVGLSVLIQKACMDTIFITKLDNGVISLKNEDYSFTFTAPTLSLFKVWLHFIHFCGNVSNIEDPSVVELIEEGFYNLVVQIIGYSMNATLQNPPDVNFILSIFFDAITSPVLYLNHRAFSGAILYSLKTMFLIIRTFAYTQVIKSSYLTMIYYYLSYAIASPSEEVQSYVFTELSV